MIIECTLCGFRLSTKNPWKINGPCPNRNCKQEGHLHIIELVPYTSKKEMVRHFKPTDK